MESCFSPKYTEKNLGDFVKEGETYPKREESPGKNKIVRMYESF